MNTRLQLVILICVTILSAQQKVELTGTVTDLAGNGVEKVAVGLIKSDLVTETNGLGEFTLKGELTSIQPSTGMNNEGMRICSNRLIFSVSSDAEPVNIELYTTRGVKVANVTDRIFAKGIHSVQLLPVKHLFANSCYVVSIVKGPYTYRFGIAVIDNTVISNRNIFSIKSNSNHISATCRQIIDTLYAEKQGVERTLVPVSAYIDSNIEVAMRIIPEFYIDKAKETPDYSQMDSDYGGLDGNGSFYCGPSSVSNGIMWLDDHGYPDLVVNTSDRKKDQHDMIIVIGSKKYMNTENVGMAPSRDVVRGVEDYIRDKGYKCTVEFQGIYYPPPDNYIDSNRTVLDWIKEKTLGNSAVYLHVTWVKYDANTDTYTSKGGHWNTVTGYGKDSNGNSNPEYLLNHDPSAPSGTTNYTRPIKFTSGTYIRSGKEYDLTTGFYKYKNGVLDGIVAVTMTDK